MTTTYLKRVGTRAGFTLLEIIIVATVVAVLLAYAVPRYMQFTYRAKVNQCRNNIMQLTLAIKTYETDHSAAADTGWPEMAGTVTAQHPLVTGGYIDVTPPRCKITHGLYSLLPVYGPYGDVIGWKVNASEHFVNGNWRTGAHVAR